MTVDRKRLILSCVHWDQFIFLIAEDDPMRCPRMDHFGLAVGSRAELEGVAERARPSGSTTTGSTSSMSMSTTRGWSRSTRST
jgi:hypothetical protein